MDPIPSNFKRLIGVWKTSGQVITEHGNIILKGTDSYEWILDGKFILHKADVMMGNEKSKTLEMIIPDRNSYQSQMQYFNSKGETGIMQSELKDNIFTIEGQGIRFEGTINDNDSEVIGQWYLQSKHDNWEVFIHLRLEKMDEI